MRQPSSKKAALGNIEGAVGDLEAALGVENCSDPDELEALTEDLAGIARAVASGAIEKAIALGGDLGDVGAAQASQADGDVLRAAEQYKDAVGKYKDAVADV